MTTGDLINRIISYTDNVDSADVDNAQLRTRILQYTQEVFDSVWHKQPWPFKLRKQDPVTVASGGVGNLPANFEDLGPNGAVFRKDNGWKLKETDMQEIFNQRSRPGFSDNNPCVFAIGSMDVTGTTGLKQLHVGNLSAAMDFIVWYEAAPPILVDSTIASNNLQYIPSQYHFSVILNGVHARTSKGLGDSRDWMLAYREGLAEMVAREMPKKSTVNQIPRAIRGKW